MVFGSTNSFGMIILCFSYTCAWYGVNRYINIQSMHCIVNSLLQHDNICVSNWVYTYMYTVKHLVRCNQLSGRFELFLPLRYLTTVDFSPGFSLTWLPGKMQHAMGFNYLNVTKFTLRPRSLIFSHFIFKMDFCPAFGFVLLTNCFDTFSTKTNDDYR